MGSNPAALTRHQHRLPPGAARGRLGRFAGLGHHRRGVAYLLLLFVAGRCLVPMDETDLFFNLRLGEVVLSSGHVPTENLLSFTHPAAVDVNLAWLFQIVLALVFRAGGVAGVVVMKTAFVLATWALLFRVAVRRGAHPALAALVLALAAWSAEPRFVERPHLVTFLGLAFLLLALERAEAGRPRGLWLLVPLGLAWANANSCFFLAPSILLLYAAGARLDGRRTDARRAGLVALALLPLLFATPSGANWLSYVANHWRMPALRPLQEYRMAEWPLDGPFFFLVGGLGLAVLASRLMRMPALIPWRVLLPLAVLGFVGARRIRFVAEFSMLAGPALAVALTRLGPWLRGRVLTAGAALALAGLTAAPRALGAGPWLDLGIEADLVPEAAVDFVEQRGLRERMYNDLEVGSYLTWRGWPRYRVFQDPRINGYPADFHAVLKRADLSLAEWQGLLDGFGVDAALITYPDLNPRGALFDPQRWALVYRTAEALVFTRRLSARATVIEELELPMSFSYSTATGLQPVLLRSRPAASPVPDCEWRRRVGELARGLGDERRALEEFAAALQAEPVGPCAVADWRADARGALGALALRLGDPARAATALEGLQAPQAATNHAFARLALAQPTPALDEFEVVLARTPDHAQAALGRALALSALGRREQAVAALQALLARTPGAVVEAAARAELRRLGLRAAHGQ